MHTLLGCRSSHHMHYMCLVYQMVNMNWFRHEEFWKKNPWREVSKYLWRKESVFRSYRSSPHRKTPVPESAACNFIKKETLVFLRTRFLQNNSRRLLLFISLKWFCFFTRLDIWSIKFCYFRRSEDIT